MTEKISSENLDEESSAEDAVLSEEAAVESSEPKELSIEEQLAEKEAEAAKNLDGWQRALADLANARKRFEKQSQIAYLNATVEVVSKLLPVIDDFDRAMENVPTEIAENGWFEGLSGTLRKLNTILESINAERIPTVGESFDPNYHDAISMEPSDEFESGIIIRELQAGYRIGDRVVRAALVFVAA